MENLWTLSVLVVSLSLLGVQGTKEAAVWLDDGEGHTIKELLTPEESEEFSKSLRETMGLPDPANFKPKHNNLEASAPKFMKSIYDTLDELGIPRDKDMDPVQRDILERADTVVTFTSKAPPVRMIPAPRHHAPNRLLYFNTSEVSLDHTLLSAELRLHYQPKVPEYADQHLQQIVKEIREMILHVYLVTDEKGGEMKIAEEELTQEGWIVMNMTVPTLAWILQPRGNRGLRLAVTTKGHKHEHNLHHVGLSTAHDREDHRPILVAFFSLPNGRTAAKPTVNGAVLTSPYKNESDPAALLSRSKRASGFPLDPGNNRKFPPVTKSETSCQMKPLYVSFSDLDWQNWVIAPNGYDANFCEGRCDFPMHADVNATNHAIVQTLIKVLRATRDGHDVPPAACCAPKELLTISVLYYDYHNNVVLKKYPKMVVKNCACR